MAHLWQVTKQLLGWMLGWDNQDDCNCNWSDDEDKDVQESSGLGTVLVVSAVLVGLIMAANLIPSQPPPEARLSQRERELRKEQQQRRIKQLAERTRDNALKIQQLDIWCDALAPTEEEAAQWQVMSQLSKKHPNSQLPHAQLRSKLVQSVQEDYYDLPTDNSEDHFMEALDE